MNECKLLNNTFSYLMQFLLAVLSFGTLFLKRKIEKPKRHYRVFLFDISKQVFSSLFAHALNILFALLLASKIKENSDECRSYFINFFCDVSFGIPISYGLTKTINYYAKKNNFHYLISGNYPENANIISVEYFCQTLIWIFIVLFYKILVFFGLILPFFSSWQKFGKSVINNITNDSHTELFLVMVLFPTIFNIIQFWVTDYFLKATNKTQLINSPKLNTYSEL